MDIPIPGVRFLLTLTSVILMPERLDGIHVLADAREAAKRAQRRAGERVLAGDRGAQIASVQLADETQRVYQAGLAGTDFVPEIDTIDRESVYREFRQITDSTPDKAAFWLAERKAAGGGCGHPGGGAPAGDLAERQSDVRQYGTACAE